MRIIKYEVNIHCPKAIKTAIGHFNREHLRLYFAYCGAGLMAFDAIYACVLHGMLEHYIAEHTIHVVEVVASNGGKTGAALAGFSVFFERIMKITEDINN